MNTKRLLIFNLLVRLLPPTRCLSFKVKLLRWCGAKVGQNVSIFSPRILGRADLIIGDNAWIGHEALIFGPKGSSIRIDDFAKVGSRAIVVTGYHEYSIAYDNIAGPGKWADVRICKGSCVGTMAIILPGKTIGEKAHVSAGSVVTHNVPAYHRVA